MLDCCDGHSIEILMRASKGKAENIKFLSIDEAVEIANMLEEGECPVCSGLIPLRQDIVQYPFPFAT